MGQRVPRPPGICLRGTDSLTASLVSPQSPCLPGNIPMWEEMVYAGCPLGRVLSPLLSPRGADQGSPGGGGSPGAHGPPADAAWPAAILLASVSHRPRRIPSVWPRPGPGLQSCRVTSPKGVDPKRGVTAAPFADNLLHRGAGEGGTVAFSSQSSPVGAEGETEAGSSEVSLFPPGSDRAGT